MKTRPPCVSIYPWLKHHFGGGNIASLSGTDIKALEAVAQIVALYGYDSSPQVIEAFGLVVQRMQLQSQWAAYQAIAHGLDWDFRDRIWAEAKLPNMSQKHRAYDGRSTPPRPGQGLAT